MTLSSQARIHGLLQEEKGAPVALVWNQGIMTTDYLAVPKGSKHPAAATLWAMWMGSPEAEAVWQAAAHEENIAFGQTAQDKLAKQSLADAGTKPISWYDSPATLEQLKWWSTPDGTDYRNKIKEAVTQRK